jgi:uncharacterized membrane protein YccC
VLRSNALSTGQDLVRGLLGTAAGFIVGAALVALIGTDTTLLWILLPFAVLVAGVAPAVISFAAGQAGFTVVLFVLFNIIQPVGWSVGLVRIEDVAIGFAISLGVGLLFWPRGAAAVLRADLANAYASSADYAVAAVRHVIDGRGADPAAARAADAALHRLDDAFRQYLAERSASTLNLEDVAALVGGAARVRRAGQSLESLGRMVHADARLDRCGANLDRELHALQSWYAALGYALSNDRAVPPPHLRDLDGRSRLLACVGAAAGDEDPAAAQAALPLLWATQHLDNLWRLEAHIAERADGTR